jgi:CCR4-NOT transcriptional regulation complex NOT5 subunit
MNKVRSGLVVAAAVLLSLSLSGCSALYPHWGATDFPTDGPTNSSSTSASPSTSASASPSSVPVQAAKVQLMQVNVDATAGVVDVVAQVTNVSEDGGSCTITVASGTTSKQQTVRAESNVDTTQCFPLEVSLSGLTSGTGTVTVSYKSAGYVGSSLSQAITIP